MFSLLLSLWLYGYISNIQGMIGIVWNPVDHGIIRVYKNSPAEEMGILPGDIVLKIDGSWDGEIEGTPGTKVNLTIKRGDVIVPNVWVRRADPREFKKDGK